MKKKYLLFIFLLACKISNGQKLNLQNIINSSYSKRDQGFLDSKVLCVLIPANINFIDTSKTNVKELHILFFSEPSFEKYIKKNDSALVLQVTYDSLGIGELQITLEISKVDVNNYFNTPKLYTYVDKKTVLLKYDSAKKTWGYNKLVKQWGDF